MSKALFVYLLKTGLDQVIWEKIPDQVQKGIKAVDLLVPWGGGDLTSPEFWVSRVNPKDQDDTQNSSDYCGGHIVHHCSSAHSATGASIQTSQTCKPDREKEIFINVSTMM